MRRGHAGRRKPKSPLRIYIVERHNSARNGGVKRTCKCGHLCGDPMMEYLKGLPDDVLAVIWHDMRDADDRRALLEPERRDRLAGRHDVRLLARYSDRARTGHVRIEDLMRGAGLWRDFGRIAIVTDEPSVRYAVQFFGPFFHGPIRVFKNAQSAQARDWVRARM